jgi:hypothetical protein
VGVRADGDYLLPFPEKVLFGDLVHSNARLKLHRADWTLYTSCLSSG